MKRPYKALPPVELLWELLSLNPLTGQLYWNNDQRGRKAGSPAGCVCTRRGYTIVNSPALGGLYLGHRLIAAWLGWSLAEHLEIDHKNRNPQDNRPSNLRVCTPSENRSNMPRRNESGLRGVQVRKNRQTGEVVSYRAYIKRHGKQQSLGNYATAEEAHAAYQQAASELFGEFACFDSK